MPSILESLKIDDVKQLHDTDLVASLDKDEVISKLLASVNTLQSQVEQLTSKLGQYEKIDKLLDLDDLATDDGTLNAMNEGPEPPATVQALGVHSNKDEKIPIGFTPMYSAPALNEVEIQPKSKEEEDSRRFIRPWPEVTLNQLASRFKIPRDMLTKTARRLGGKEMDKTNLKPIRESDMRRGKRRGPGRPPKRRPSASKQQSDQEDGSVERSETPVETTPEKSATPDENIDPGALSSTTKRIHDAIVEEASKRQRSTPPEELAPTASSKTVFVFEPVAPPAEPVAVAEPESTGTIDEDASPSRTNPNRANGSNNNIDDGASPSRAIPSEPTVSSDSASNRTSGQSQAGTSVTSALEYTITPDLRYSCNGCRLAGVEPHIFETYMELYHHKHDKHPEEFAQHKANSTGGPAAAKGPQPEVKSPSPDSDNVDLRDPEKQASSKTLLPYYTRGDDKSYRCELCTRRPFTSYHGIYAHLRSIHYNPFSDKYENSTGGFIPVRFQQHSMDEASA